MDYESIASGSGNSDKNVRRKILRIQQRAKENENEQQSRLDRQNFQKRLSRQRVKASQSVSENSQSESSHELGKSVDTEDSVQGFETTDENELISDNDNDEELDDSILFGSNTIQNKKHIRAASSISDYVIKRPQKIQVQRSNEQIILSKEALWQREKSPLFDIQSNSSQIPSSEVQQEFVSSQQIYSSTDDCKSNITELYTINITSPCNGLSNL